MLSLKVKSKNRIQHWFSKEPISGVLHTAHGVAEVSNTTEQLNTKNNTEEAST